MVGKKTVDGGDALYHCFAKALKGSDMEIYRRFIKKAIDVLGVWMPLDAYARMPIYHPYVKRSQNCRGNPKKGIPDMWGSPDDDGCFRDDNTMVKNIANSLSIVSKESWYNGARGKNFIASHVWREPADIATTRVLASRRADLYSFIPNVMWLPKQISKLTDEEGGFAQHYIQALSRHIYGDVVFKSAMGKIVDSCWSLLPAPMDMSDVSLPDRKDIAFFNYDEKAVSYRIGIVQQLDTILKEILDDGSSSQIFRPCKKRYVSGLNALPRSVVEKFYKQIDRYVSAL